MNRLKKKIRSQTGASLTFALLLFLVCAVVGSVVLTAGTAAAGRMSKISEMDQRYYSVNSAAKLLIDLFQTDEKIFCEKKEPGETTSVTGGSPEEESATTVSAKDYKFVQKGIDISKKKTLVTDAINQIIEMPGDTNAKDQTVKLEISGLNEENINLDVAIKEKIHKNGDLDFEISNDVSDEENKNGKYTINLFFMNIGQSGSEQYKTYQWKLTDIETLSKLPSD